jgi:hypothetical protein
MQPMTVSWPLPNAARLYVTELVHPEQTLLWALRALAEPAESRQWLWREFCCLFSGSEAGVDAFAALARLVRLLTRQGRRPFRTLPLDHHEVGADERCFLSLLAAVQAGRDDHAAALLRWLMPPAPRVAALGAAKCVAQAIEESGRRLCCRPVADGAAALLTRGGACPPVRLAPSKDGCAQCASAQLGPTPDSATSGTSSGTAGRLASSITARTTAAVNSTSASGTSNTSSSCT